MSAGDPPLRAFARRGDVMARGPAGWGPVALAQLLSDQGDTFLDNLFAILGNIDRSKRLVFQADTQNTGKTTTIDVGAQSASRTLTLPVMAGNRTAAVIDQAQTFSALQTFGSGLKFANETLSNYHTTAFTVADGSGAGLTFTSISVKYTQIGNVVFVSGNFTYPATVDASAASFTLPVAVVGSNCVGDLLSTTINGNACIALATTSRANIYPSGSLTPATNAQMSLAQVFFSVSYFAS